jgi:HD-like signal output (HDOD) protein
MANRIVAPPPISFDFDRAIRGAVARGGLPIPPYPAVALRIQQVVGRKDFGLAEVSGIVGSDPTLAADVLRCANSSLYSRGDPVTGLGPAITRIGAHEVTRLALSSGLSAHAQGPGSLAPVKRAIWTESVAGAVLCQELARLRGLRAEEAFVVGLLHDFGRVVTTCCIEALLETHRGIPARTQAEWAELVDRHHVEVGLATAAQWGLPPLVTEVIALHHGPAVGEHDPQLLDVVRASDQVVLLLSARPEVGAEDLARVPGIAAGERELLARVIEKIPGFVAAFEAPAARRAGPASMVAAPITALRPGERPVTFQVTVSVDKRPRSYLAAAVTSSGLVMVGAEPLPENMLLELSLQCPPRPFKIWATAKVQRAEGSVVRIELQPYALGGEARGLWNRLYAGAPTA